MSQTPITERLSSSRHQPRGYHYQGLLTPQVITTSAARSALPNSLTHSQPRSRKFRGRTPSSRQNQPNLPNSSSEIDPWKFFYSLNSDFNSSTAFLEIPLKDMSKTTAELHFVNGVCVQSMEISHPNPSIPSDPPPSNNISNVSAQDLDTVIQSGGVPHDKDTASHSIIKSERLNEGNSARHHLEKAVFNTVRKLISPFSTPQKKSQPNSLHSSIPFSTPNQSAHVPIPMTAPVRKHRNRFEDFAKLSTHNGSFTPSRPSGHSMVRTMNTISTNSTPLQLLSSTKSTYNFQTPGFLSTPSAMDFVPDDDGFHTPGELFTSHSTPQGKKPSTSRPYTVKSFKGYRVASVKPYAKTPRR